MIEIYKTNVLRKKQAKQIVRQIKILYPNYKVNFDLEDCDHILRINTGAETLDNNTIVRIVHENDFHIEILHDEVPVLKAQN